MGIRNTLLRMMRFTVLLVFVLGSVQLVLAQANPQRVIITDVNVANFPQVQTNVRILDEHGRHIPNILSSQLELFENERLVPEPERTLQEIEKGMRVMFVADAGARVVSDGAAGRERWGRTVNAITNFVQTTPWMVENEDRVGITAVEPTGPQTIINPSDQPDAIMSALNNYTLPRIAPPPPPADGTPQAPALQYSNPLAYIERVLADVAANPDEAQEPFVIVLITPDIETVSVERIRQVAATARELHVPIFAIQTQNPTNDNVRNLAEESGGDYIRYVSDADNLDNLFRPLVQQRKQYLISHRSSINQSGRQQIEVNYAGGSGSLSSSKTFEIEIAPPRVSLESPSSGAIIKRESATYVTDPDAVQPTNYTVVATIDFPDGFERELNIATLLVNGASVGQVRNPQSRIQIPWDLRTFKTPGTTEVSLQLEVQDELGLNNTSPPMLVKIELFIPQEEIGEVISTRIVTIMPPTATPIPCLTSDPLCNRVERPLRANPVQFVSLGIALAALVFAGVIWTKRGQLAVVGGQVAQNVSNFVERVTGRRVQAKAKARLSVLEGDANLGRPLEIYGDTRLGRSPQFADLLFQRNNEDSPISRLHATIIDRETYFAIRDEESANGTFVNGLRVTPLQEEILSDGDEIELAQIERGGVKLQFFMMETSTTQPSDTSRHTIRNLNQPGAPGPAAPGAYDDDTYEDVF